MIRAAFQVFYEGPRRSKAAELPARMARGVLLVILVVAAIVVPHSGEAYAGTGLMDTSSGFHQALIFNYQASPCGSGETGIDYVWGSSCPTGGAAVHDYYLPWSQPVKTTVQGSYATLSWLQQYHPDWILYQGNKTTPSQYMYSSSSRPAIDYANPAVQQWVVQTGILPALAAGYDGIAFDDNPSLNVFQAVGHYSATGTWITQYSGATSDAAWASAQTTALTQIAALVHQSYPNAIITINNGYFPYWYGMIGSIWTGPSNATGIAGILDEGAFSTSSGVHETGNSWSEKMGVLAPYAQSHALTLLNEQGYTVTADMTDTNMTARADLQWDLANYFLVKGSHTYFFWAGNSQYGYPAIPQHEFATVQAIGSPTNSFYTSQGVYMRNFTGGLALVNPDSSTSYTVTLPAGAYKDLYGNSVTTYTMPPASGLVLLSTTTTSASTATPTPTISLTSPTQTPSTNSSSPVSLIPVSSSYASAVLANSPLAYYRLDQTSGTSAADSSGNGHSGTYVGAVTLGVSGATADGDTAISLPGTSSAYMSTPSVSLGSAFSLEGWVKPANYLASGQYIETLFGTSLNASNTVGYVPAVNGGSAAGKFLVHMGGSLNFVTSHSYAAGSWYHVVYTWDGTNQKIYVNGQLDATGTATATNATPSWGGITYVGADVPTRKYPSPLQGSVDEAALYPTALTATQVSNHYQAASSTSTSTKTPVPTATTAPTATSTIQVTDTPIPTVTNTPVPTATQTVVPRATNTPMPTATSAPIATSTSILQTPGAPTNVTAIGDNGSATVQWNAPTSNGGSAITQYVIRAFAGTTVIETVTVPVSSLSTTSYVVGQLHNGQTYTFTVQAVNMIGPGPQSMPSNSVRPPWK